MSTACIKCQQLGKQILCQQLKIDIIILVVDMASTCS